MPKTASSTPEEGEGHPEREEQEQRDRDQREPAEQHREFAVAMTFAHLLGREQVFEAQEVQVEALEGEQREEQPALAAGDPAVDSAGLDGVLGDEGDGVDLDVGILAHMIRVRVVPGMLGVPPVEAEPDTPGQQSGQTCVRAAAPEHLAMAGLVPDEGDLGEDDAEDAGDDELEPAGAQDQEHRDAGGEDHGDRCAHRDVEPRGALEQTGGLRVLGDLGEGPRLWRKRIRVHAIGGRSRGRGGMFEGNSDHGGLPKK